LSDRENMANLLTYLHTYSRFTIPFFWSYPD